MELAFYKFMLSETSKSREGVFLMGRIDWLCVGKNIILHYYITNILKVQGNGCF